MWISRPAAEDGREGPDLKDERKERKHSFL
jgi:hypothetical protein